MADEEAGLVPIPVSQLYEELGKRLTPEQKAEDLDARAELDNVRDKEAEAADRSWRLQEVTAPARELLPSLS